MTPVTAAKVKYGAWGLIGGAIIAMIIGFAWGGWTTSGTTQRMGDEAVLAARAAICQIAARAAKTASSPIRWVVPRWSTPPGKADNQARMAPPIRPHTPYFTFAAVTGVMDHPSRDSQMAGHVHRRQ